MAGGLLRGWVAPGYLFLFAFALPGAGQMNGAYTPNYAVTLSRPEAGARNLSLLGLAGPVASFAPALHGYLTDRYGFGASFLFDLGAALLGLWLTARIRPPRAAGSRD